MVNNMEVRRLIRSEIPIVEEEIAFNYIQKSILNSSNVLIPRLFNKIWVILSKIKSNSTPAFYHTPLTIEFVSGDLYYSGEIIKHLTTPKLKCDVFEVKIDQHPNYHRILFVMKEDSSQSFVLFTYGFTKIPEVIDHKTNWYSLLSDKLYKNCHIHKKGVDYQ